MTEKARTFAWICLGVLALVAALTPDAQVGPAETSESDKVGNGQEDVSESGSEDAESCQQALLQEILPDGLELLEGKFAWGELPCHEPEIAEFEATAERADIGLGPAFAIEGEVRLGPVREPYAVIDGRFGKRYMLSLAAMIVSPDGEVLWEQTGAPGDDAWVDAEGDTASFILINEYRDYPKGSTAVLIAAGNPVLWDRGTFVLLGVQLMSLKQ